MAPRLERRWATHTAGATGAGVTIIVQPWDGTQKWDLPPVSGSTVYIIILGQNTGTTVAHRQFEQIPFSEPWKRGGSSSPRRWRSRRLHGRDWEGVDTPPGRGVLFANISPRPPRMSRPPARPTRLPLSSVVSAMNIRTPSMSQPSGSCARALGRASSLQNHGT